MAGIPISGVVKVKVTTSSRCSKCGRKGFDHCKMRYDHMQDVLKITCDRCGYVWKKEPLDKELGVDEV